MTPLAPIGFFVYNRCDHLNRSMASLKQNHLAGQSDLIIYSDGPKDAADEKRVAEVRRTIQKIDGFKSIRIVLRPSNYGLSRSIVSGVSEILAHHERAVFVEDDLVVSPHFLSYMNTALDAYRDEPRVAGIHGYSFPCRHQLPETFFLRGADCWGWGTWRRGWDLFEPDGAHLLKSLKQRGLAQAFDRGAFGFLKMLKQQVDGKIDSWAIRWHAAAFLANKLTLYPGRSLVNNTGNDYSGTHCESTEHYNVDLSAEPIAAGGIPIEENTMALEAFIDFARQHRPSLLKSIGKRFSRQWRRRKT